MVKHDFKLELPLKKSYTEDMGEYHIALCISTTEKDSEGNILTEDALEDMVAQAKGINLNSNHQRDLGSIIGPVTDAWLEKEDGITYLWVDVRVRKEWEETIKDLIDAGIALGGSIEGNAVIFGYDDEDSLLVGDVRLYGAALTTMPANKATLGTAIGVSDGCPGSLCMQLSEQLNKSMEDDNLVETKEKGKENENGMDVSDKNALCKVMESVSAKLDMICSKINRAEEIGTSKEEKEDKGGDVDLENSKQEEENLKLEKELVELKKENSKLKSEIVAKEEAELVEKALELNKTLDPKTELVTKELVLEEMRQLSNGEVVGLDQMNTYVKSMELALKKIPEGDKPHVSTSQLEKGESNVQERLLQLNRNVYEMGKEEY